MAKRFEPYPPDEVPESFSKSVTIVTLNGVSVARRFAPTPELTPEQIAEQTALYEAAKASWSVLHTWKKVRWSICAIATYGDFPYMKGTPGYSGYSLYLKCWLEQGTESGKQPISPCSARATDPDASPWNYQP